MNNFGLLVAYYVSLLEELFNYTQYYLDDSKYPEFNKNFALVLYSVKLI